MQFVLLSRAKVLENLLSGIIQVGVVLNIFAVAILFPNFVD